MYLVCVCMCVFVYVDVHWCVCVCAGVCVGVHWCWCVCERARRVDVLNVDIPTTTTQDSVFKH